MVWTEKIRWRIICIPFFLVCNVPKCVFPKIRQTAMAPNYNCQSFGLWRSCSTSWATVPSRFNIKKPPLDIWLAAIVEWVSWVIWSGKLPDWSINVALVWFSRGNILVKIREKEGGRGTYWLVRGSFLTVGKVVRTCQGRVKTWWAKKPSRRRGAASQTLVLMSGTPRTHCIWLHSFTSRSADFPPKIGRGRRVTGEPRRTVSLSTLFLSPPSSSNTLLGGCRRSLCEHRRWKRQSFGTKNPTL